VGYTKRQLIEDAFDEMGLPAYVFELAPEQLQTALRRLDTMMAEWDLRGLRLGFPLGGPTSSDISADTGLPLGAVPAVVTNLAIRLAPSHGKTVAPETKSDARIYLNTLMTYAAFPNEYQWQSTLPLGAGNKPWRWLQTFAAKPQAKDLPTPVVGMTFDGGPQ
jgi:hypothetical protein